MSHIDRRTFRRYEKETHFRLRLESGTYNCRIIDYSAEGICLHIPGETIPFLPGDRIKIRIHDPELKFTGQVVWIKDNDGGGHTAGFKREGNIMGTCADFHLADIMIGLQRTMKTGILQVIQGTKLTKIYIRNGDFMFARSNQDDDQLREFLLKNQKITLKQYYTAGEKQRRTGEKIGKLLVDLKYLKPLEFFNAIRHQAEHMILDIIAAECGNFEFREGTLPADEITTLNLSAANLIYRGVKGISNFQYILEDIPPLDTVLCLSQNAADLFQNIALDDDDKVILSNVDAVNTIEEIVAKSQCSDIETVKTIYALLCARILAIRRDDTSYDVSPDEIIQERDTEEEADFIEKVNEMLSTYETLGFYNLLGITPEATPEEIKFAYWKKARDFHPDRHFMYQQDDLKDKLSKIFTHINLAYSSLLSAEKRKQYDKSVSKKGEEVTSNADLALRLFNEAKSEMVTDSLFEMFDEDDPKIMTHKLNKAEKLFSEAIYYDISKSEYHLYLGIVQSRLKKFKQASRSLNKAIEINPLCSDCYSELGHVFLDLGFSHRAKSAFDKALKMSPSDKRALEGRRIMKKRELL